MKNRTKTISLLLAVCMMLTLLPAVAFAADYDLWVGGVQVTSDNASNITGTGITGTVSYDAATNTLTLNNAKITGHYGNEGIRTQDTALTINLVGSNEVVGQYNSGNSNYGMYIRGALTFTGTGSLTASSKDATNTNSWSVAILAKGNITVGDDCTIIATCGNGKKTAAPICPYGNSSYKLILNGANVTASMNANGEPAVSCSDLSYNNLKSYKYLKIEPGTGGTTGGGNTTPATYTVTFDADGGYGFMAAASGVSGEYTLPPNGFTAPANKQFKCWSVEGVEKNPSDVITVSGNVTVTAVWEDKPETYYVRFMPGYQGNAGSMEEQVFTEGIPGNLNANAFTNPGYSFIGWDKVEKSGIATYTNGQEITLTKAIMGNNNTLTLYAQWKDSSMGGGNNNSGGSNTGGGNTGNIQHTTKPEDNQMSGNIDMSNNEIFDIVLNEQDKNSNEVIEVYLKVEDKSTVTNDEKTAIENKANGDKVAAYLDISLYKKVGSDDPVPVPNPTGKIKIKIVIPENIFHANRTYYIIYRHNGNTKTLTGELNKQTREFTFETNEFSTYALAYKENTNTGTTSGGYSGPSIWYIGGNTFGTSTSQVPTSVEIDNLPVSFTMNGSNIVVGCVAPDADRIRVIWGNVSNSIGFTPDAAASCAQVFVPKTGDVSVMAFALMAVIAAAGAMGKK